MMRPWRRLVGLALGLWVCLIATAGPLMALPQAAWAGPVNWHEVESTPEGRQWWDEGSLRISNSGLLSVLSRFQPAAANDSDAPTGQARPRILGDLYVMEIDCGQGLFRDTSINGLPRWGAQWQPVAGDGLIEAVVNESCQAAGLQPLA